jgi:hypothetical protein
MSNWLSFAISCLALGVAGVTAWLTFFRRGRLVMTQPTIIFMGPDGLAFEAGGSKVYLRTLLYCTAKRGYVLESLYLSLQRNEGAQNFNVWVYGAKGDLQRGSGLFVPQEGVTFDHHFLLPKDGTNFKFLSGNYTLRVFAKGVGERASSELTRIKLEITEALALDLAKPQTGLYFDWGPDQQSYHPHTQSRAGKAPELAKLLEFMETKSLVSTMRERPQGSNPTSEV